MVIIANADNNTPNACTSHIVPEDVPWTDPRHPDHRASPVDAVCEDRQKLGTFCTFAPYSPSYCQTSIFFGTFHICTRQNIVSFLGKASTLLAPRGNGLVGDPNHRRHDRVDVVDKVVVVDNMHLVDMADMVVRLEYIRVGRLMRGRTVFQSDRQYW